ncbi:hypothetical protein HN011_011010 [Eciton burchellii]|nr:hypothetical protein HN011_011010 [Eciton burchellii]
MKRSKANGHQPLALAKVVVREEATRCNDEEATTIRSQEGHCSDLCRRAKFSDRGATELSLTSRVPRDSRRGEKSRLDWDHTRQLTVTSQRQQ